MTFIANAPAAVDNERDEVAVGVSLEEGAVVCSLLAFAMTDGFILVQRDVVG